MNRKDFQELTDIRGEEAQALLNSGHYSGAYYLAGYAVECALKACVSRQTREYDFPDRNLVGQMYTHDLEKLIKVAGLHRDLEERMRGDAQFAVNWAIVKDWTEDSRYRTHEEALANDLVNAIADSDSGVLAWLKLHW